MAVVYCTVVYCTVVYTSHGDKKEMCNFNKTLKYSQHSTKYG